MDRISEKLLAWLTVIGVALAGRLAAHSRAVQAGQRRFWGPHLLWELPIAVCMGYIGAGVAEIMGLSGSPQLAVVAAASYLGPDGVEAIVTRILDRRL